MKTYMLLLLLLMICTGCIDQEPSQKSEQKEEYLEQPVSDHAQLQEAKAIARKLFEGLEQVEKEEISRVEFESISRPLQKKLNILIMSLDEEELQELEEFREKLLSDQVEGI